MMGASPQVSDASTSDDDYDSSSTTHGHDGTVWIRMATALSLFLGTIQAWTLFRLTIRSYSERNTALAKRLHRTDSMNTGKSS